MFEINNIQGVDIIANRGSYEKKGIMLSADAIWSYYSDYYGIDKAKVVDVLNKEYSKV